MAGDDNVTPRPLRYAGGDDEDETGIKPRGVSYHGGSRVGWTDDMDNPLSPNFVPLTQRGERGKMRWWAMMSKRRRKQSHGQFDP